MFNQVQATKLDILLMYAGAAYVTYFVGHFCYNLGVSEGKRRAKAKTENDHNVEND